MSDQTAANVIPADCGDCSGEPTPANEALSERRGNVIFKIHGMDCADEVAVLKREVGPVVGSERLSFDLVNGRMSVAGAPGGVDHVDILQAVERTGMRAELWREGEASAVSQNEDRRRRIQMGLTVASGVLVAAGFAIHASVSGIAAVLHESLAREAHPPLLAMLAYAVWHGVALGRDRGRCRSLPPGRVQWHAACRARPAGSISRLFRQQSHD